MNYSNVDLEWAERIAEEVDQLKRRGYHTTVDFDSFGRFAYVRAYTARDTEAGQQPISVYFVLGRGFPQEPPVMKTGIAMQQVGPDGDLIEFTLEVDSKRRLLWDPSSKLFELVADVRESANSPYLKVLPIHPYAQWPPEVPEESLGQILPNGATRPKFDSFGSIRTTIRLSETGQPELTPHSLAAPKDERGVNSSSSSILKPKGITDTLHTLSSVNRSVNQLSLRERLTKRSLLIPLIALLSIALAASLAALILSPLIIVIIFLSIALAVSLAALMFSPPNSVDMTSLWAQTDGLVKGKFGQATVNQLEESIAALRQIRLISSDARRPSDNERAEILLFESYIALGDKHYSQNLRVAEVQYRCAAELQPNDRDVRDRLNWVRLDQQIASAQLETWPSVIEELENNEQDRQDPVGRTIALRLYDAYLKHAQDLLGHAEDVLLDGTEVQRDALAAQRQIDAACRLGIGSLSVANELNRRANKLLQASGSYEIEVSNPNANQWQELLAQLPIADILPVTIGLSLTPTLDVPQPNLLLLAPISSMMVKIIPSHSPKGEPYMANRFGIIIKSVAEGEYIVTLEGDKIKQEGVIVLSRDKPFGVVRIVPR